jgi:hypothetical protein
MCHLGQGAAAGAPLRSRSGHLAEAIKTSQVSEIDALNQALTRLGAQPVR